MLKGEPVCHRNTVIDKSLVNRINCVRDGKEELLVHIGAVNSEMVSDYKKKRTST
jgi:hypothetical protein